MHFGVALVLVDEVHRAAGARQQTKRAADWLLQSIRERVLKRCDRHAARAIRLVERGRSTEAGLTMLRRAVVPRRKKQSVPATDDGGTVEREAETGARRHLDGREIPLLGGGAADTRENQAAGQGSARQQSRLGNKRVERTDRLFVESHGLAVVDFLQAIFMFESDAVIHR